MNERREFNRDDPRAIQFHSPNDRISAILKIDLPAMDTLPDDERRILELTIAGFASMLKANLLAKDKLAMVGLSHADALTIVMTKLEEANKLLSKARNAGLSKMG